MIRVILVRHGETQWNTENRFQGHLDSPLTEGGRSKAIYLANRLKGFHFNAFYSSDLGRAVSTADLIKNIIEMDYISDKLLREVNMGIFSGLTRDTIAKDYPIEWKDFRTRSPRYSVPEGESDEQLLKRILGFMGKVKETHAEGQILAVTHGGVIHQLVRHILGIPQEKPRKFHLKNLGLFSFIYEKDQWMVETIGDTAHLEGLYKN
jgi:2,3-bisphosphoglycerate-dependent phosphoglycerate mutase